MKRRVRRGDTLALPRPFTNLRFPLQSVRQVELQEGNLVIDLPVPSHIIVNGAKSEEMTKLRYTAATCDPNDFLRSVPLIYEHCTETHPSLKIQVLFTPISYGPPDGALYSHDHVGGPFRFKVLRLMSTCRYNEDEILFVKTMNACVVSLFPRRDDERYENVCHSVLSRTSRICVVALAPRPGVQTVGKK
jgi:hypothetical protein